METDVLCISEGDTLRQAGHRMRDLGVTALRVRGADGKPQGTVSRDMIVRGIAAGGDPKVLTVGDLAAEQAAATGLALVAAWLVYPPGGKMPATRGKAPAAAGRAATGRPALQAVRAA